MQPWNFIRDVWSDLQGDFGKVIGGIILGAAIAFGGLIIEALKRGVRFFYRLWRARRDVGRVSDGYGNLVEGRGVWLASPIKKPSNFQLHVESAKILMVANLKGGVCKTSIAANAGAYLSQKLPKPVLLIDLDFQGSLSAMASPGDWIPAAGDSQATQLVSGDFTGAAIAAMKNHALNFPKLHLLASYYDLASAENRLMVEWLIGDRRHDTRYTLANTLHTQSVKDRYSLIIIDAPPRLTAASIQATCASSHVIIPTIMDQPSSDAVVRFVRQIETFKGTTMGSLKGEPLNPHIEYLGVVGTMMQNGEHIELIETRLRDALRRSFDKEGAGGVTSLVDNSLYFHRSRYVSRPDAPGIAYGHLGSGVETREIKSRIEALGDYIAARMGIYVC